jgi:hypothetical protein
MRRMYRALFWLAGVGVVAELMIMSMLALNAGQPPSYAGSGDTGLNSLAFIWLPTLSSIAQYFNEGAALLAVAVAWADQRTSWLVALAVVTALAMLYPSVLRYLDTRGVFNSSQTGSATPLGMWIAQYSFLLFNVALLLPAALALTFAWRGRSERATVRASADAASASWRSRAARSRLCGRVAMSSRARYRLQT